MSGVHRKDSFKVIALNHERTPDAIKAQLKKMAAEYWFHDWRTVEDIVRITGLTKKAVEAAIQYRYKQYPTVKQEDTVAELKAEIVTMKEDMKEILRLMNAIYDFETK